MKAYVLVDDLVKELNQTYKGEIPDYAFLWPHKRRGPLKHFPSY